MGKQKDLKENKINSFQDLIKCCANIELLKLDKDLNILSSFDDSLEKTYDIFLHDECFEYLKQHISKNNTNPLVLSNTIEMSWIAAFETRNNKINVVYLMGPILNHEVTKTPIINYLNDRKYSSIFIDSFISKLNSIPIISLVAWLQYGVMLHYTITSEKIYIDDFSYQINSNSKYEEIKDLNLPKVETWIAERNALQMIEDGNLNFKNAFSNLTNYSDSFQDNNKTDIRKNKNLIISFITICTRSAIKGGLDIETAYAIGQRYIDAVEFSKTMLELININRTMYQDFIYRVNKTKIQNGLSKTISSLKNYIDFHIEENISLKDLALKFNYSESRLAQKFKEEVGIPISIYLKNKRIEKAKMLLSNTNDSIQDISEKLGFCNTSYFIETFKSITGVTPKEFRN